jgi:uncharacterized protein
MMRKFLLSIDGGGIRGIIPAMALQKLEELTCKPARETFSFVAGTSTGALLASAIAAGLPASKMVNIYLRRIQDIFTPATPWNDILMASRGHKYEAANLHKVLVEEFGAAANWTLNDCPIDILLPATRVEDAKTAYFVRDSAQNASKTGKLKLLDCATASAAAPTYFDPWPITPGPGRMVDGGVGTSGNPVYQTCVEAFYYSSGYVPAETTVISFGTGSFVRKQDPHLVTEWLSWVLDALLHSPEEQQTALVARHYPETIFYRLDPALTANIEMDAIGRIGELEAMGKEFAARVDWEAMLDGKETPFRLNPPALKEVQVPT